MLNPQVGGWLGWLERLSYAQRRGNARPRLSAARAKLIHLSGRNPDSESPSLSRPIRLSPQDVRVRADDPSWPSPRQLVHAACESSGMIWP